MNSIQIENLWRLMSEYNFEVDNPCFNDELLCVVCKKLMVDACQSVCGCRYCYKCISDYLGTEDKFCPGGNIKCREEYLILSTDVVRDRRINNRISRVMVKCPHPSCSTKVELAQMEDHIRLCSKQSTLCPYKPIGCDNEGGAKDKILEHLTGEMLSHTQLLVEWVQILKNEIDGMKEMYEVNKAEMKEDSKRKDIKINALEDEISRLKSGIRVDASMEERIEMTEASFVGQSSTSDVVENVDLSPSVPFTWKFNDFSKKRGPNMYSEPFFSCGYKLCLSVFLYGDGVGINCVIMKGNKDAELEWPMKKVVTLSILDQVSSQAHKSQAFQYDTYNNKSAFDRPINDRTNFVGSNPFILYSDIRDNASVVVADSIVVACAVTEPNSLT